MREGCGRNFCGDGAGYARVEGEVEVEVGGVNPLGGDFALRVGDGDEEAIGLGGGLELCRVFDRDGNGVERVGRRGAEWDGAGIAGGLRFRKRSEAGMQIVGEIVRGRGVAGDNGASSERKSDGSDCGSGDEKKDASEKGFVPC